MQNEFYIAVYGTLMQGERNFERLPEGEVEVIDNVLTDEARFEMYINLSTTMAGQMTPSVSFKENGHRLHVQIMKVTQSGRDEMDEIEGAGVNYDRVPVKIKKYPSAEIYLKRDTSQGTTDSPHRIHDNETNSLRWCAHP